MSFNYYFFPLNNEKKEGEEKKTNQTSRSKDVNSTNSYSNNVGNLDVKNTKTSFVCCFLRTFTTTDPLRCYIYFLYA